MIMYIVCVCVRARARSGGVCFVCVHACVCTCIMTFIQHYSLMIMSRL